MQQQVHVFFWFFSLLFLGMTSCSVETARPEKNQALVIASDVLKPEDTVLFEKFIADNNIRLEIRPLSTKEIIDEVKSKGYNSQIDIVFSKSMHTPIELHKNGVLQNIVEAENDTKNSNQYVSFKYNFVGIGLDPFVFKYTNDSVKEPKEYQDLVNHAHAHTLSHSDLVSFMSPLRRGRNRAQMYEWAKRWKKNTSVRSESGPWGDSASVILCKYSQLETISDSVWQNYPKGHFYPNQNSSGVYFDLMTVAIIDQAEHYADAQKFVDFCQNPGFNTFLGKKFHHFPIYDYLTVRSEGPLFYGASIDRLLQYHDVLDRMLNKLPTVDSAL